MGLGEGGEEGGWGGGLRGRVGSVFVYAARRGSWPHLPCRQFKSTSAPTIARAARSKQACDTITQTLRTGKEKPLHLRVVRQADCGQPVAVDLIH